MWQKFITKCVRYYKVRQVLKTVTDCYYRVHQVKCDRLLLQNVSGITMCGSYYNARRKARHLHIWNHIINLMKIFLFQRISPVRTCLSFPILLKFKYKLRVLLKKIFLMENISVLGSPYIICIVLYYYYFKSCII